MHGQERGVYAGGLEENGDEVIDGVAGVPSQEVDAAANGPDAVGDETWDRYDQKAEDKGKEVATYKSP